VSRAGQALPAREVRVPIPGGALEATLQLPADAAGVVVFAHAVGGGRAGGRDAAVAARLREDGLGTLLVDLLTPGEAEADRETGLHRADAPLLGTRVGAALEWLSAQPATAGLPMGVVGSSTAGAAALLAAAEWPHLVGAVVCRDGRADLAGPALERVRAPVLLVVGGEDGPAAGLARAAARALAGPAEVEVVPGAGHLFEEPGALARVGDLAAGWMTRHLPG
jgi:dienelactone hydrolase